MLQASLEFFDSTAEFFDFLDLWPGRRPGVPREKIAYEFQRARNGAFRFREPRVDGVLSLLVKVERTVQVPGQKLVSGFIGSPDELSQELQRQRDFALAGVFHNDLGEDQ